MSVFPDMKDAGVGDYRLDGYAEQADPDAEDAADREIVAANPLDVFAEDAIWLEFQINSTQNQQDQKLKIARHLLATTTLTRHEIADLLLRQELQQVGHDQRGGGQGGLRGGRRVGPGLAHGAAGRRQARRVSQERGDAEAAQCNLLCVS